MTNEVKKEISTLAQYLGIALITGCGDFYLLFVRSPSGQMINLTEAWKSYAPLLQSLLLLFSLLSVIRFALWLLIHRLTKDSSS